MQVSVAQLVRASELTTALPRPAEVHISHQIVVFVFYAKKLKNKIKEINKRKDEGES